MEKQEEIVIISGHLATLVLIQLCAAAMVLFFGVGCFISRIESHYMDFMKWGLVVIGIVQIISIYITTGYVKDK